MPLLRDNMLFIVSTILLGLLIAGSSALQQQSAGGADASTPAAQAVATGAAPAQAVQTNSPQAPQADAPQPTNTAKPSVRGRFFDEEDD